MFEDRCFRDPLSRPYPVPDVKSAEDLVSRFGDILDDEILEKSAVQISPAAMALATICSVLLKAD